MALLLTEWCILCLLVFIILVRRKRVQVRNKRYWTAVALAMVICVLIEGVGFNISALRTSNLEPVELDLSKNISEQINEIVIENIEENTTTLYVAFSGPVKITTVKAALKDDASRESFVGADTCQVSPGSSIFNTAFLRIESNGLLHAIKLNWDTEDADLLNLTINMPVPYNFSVLRFAILFFISIIIITIRSFELHQFIWDPTDYYQKTLYIICMLFCVLLSEGVNKLVQPYDVSRFPYTQIMQYPIEDGVSNHSGQTHAIMFDTLFHDGVVQEEPDEVLINLDNPYDPSQRSSSGASFLFDYVLFNGKYYIYFGLAPVLIYYLPFFFMQGFLPSYIMAAHFFALISIIGGFASFWEIAKYYTRRVSVVALFLLSSAAVLGSNILMLQSCADRYYLSIQSMQAFFFLSLWSGFRAVGQDKQMLRSIYFVLCAIFTTLLIWSRPIVAISEAGWLIPLFILVLLDHKRTSFSKSLDAVSYLFPLSFGLAAIMYFNWCRFGSILDFGNYYQLTIEDTSYNDVCVQNLLSAVWYYYLDGVAVRGDFPWVRATSLFINHSGNYFYGVVNAGAMVMPITWGSVLVSMRKDAQYKNKYVPVLPMALLTTVIVALIDYGIAGVAQRYVCDILPTLCLVGSVMMLNEVRFPCYEMTNQGKEGSISFHVCVLICALTFIVAVCFVFSNYRNFISSYAPDNYLYFARTLSIM